MTAYRLRVAAGWLGRRIWLLALIALLWWLATSQGWVASYKLPSPQAVWRALEHGFGGALWHTLRWLLEGWIIGAASAVVLGVLTGSARWLEEGIRPLLAGLQSVPTIAFLPLAILWLGYDERAVIAITAFGTFKPMMLATYGAIRQVPPSLRQAGRVLGARGLFYQRTLILPAIVPSLVVGLKLSWSFAWRSLLAAEIIVSGTAGLGQVLERGREVGAIDVVIAVIVVIAAVGILFEQLVFARFERFVNRRWGLLGAR